MSCVFNWYAVLVELLLMYWVSELSRVYCAMTEDRFERAASCQNWPAIKLGVRTATYCRRLVCMYGTTHLPRS